MIFNNEEYKIKIWNGEQLNKYISFDCETTIAPFHETPDLVTAQAYDGSDTVYYIPKEKLFLFLNKHYDAFFIGHNMPFDMGVIAKELGSTSLIYDLYDRNKIRDTGILYRLLHLASVGFVPFKYNLGMLSEKYLGIPLDKDGIERTTFAQYLNKPITDISQEHLEYGASDVIATHYIYNVLISLIKPHDKFDTLLSHDIQVKGDWALNQIYKEGIGFDLEKKNEWLSEMIEQIDLHKDILASWGWVRGSKGIKDRYESIVTLLGIADKLPKTEDGSISSKADDLEKFNEMPFIKSYLEHQKLEKAMSFVQDLHTDVIHPRYNTLLNTGRTSCSKPNFQQLPRVGGIREMFVPKDRDNTFLITDYSTLELCTLAQVMYKEYGESIMMEQINEGNDLHKFYASIMNSCDIAEVTKQQRQEAKAANFGFPGGLGTSTFIQFSEGYGLNISESEAYAMKEAWHNAFPETRKYLAGENGYVYTLTGRKRGNTSYCAEKNTPFQGLAADGAKIALYNLAKAGFKIVGFVHDEIITEVPKKRAEALLKMQEKIMIDSMRTVTPHVKISVESQISECYTK